VGELRGGDADPELRHARASVAELSGADGELILAVSGEVDLSSVDGLRAAVERAIRHAPRTLVFELSDLDFMDSSGIAVLLTAAEQIGAVELRNPSEIIRRVIVLSGLTDVLRMAP
jgi:anti-anti-sigma factor